MHADNPVAEVLYMKTFELTIDATNAGLQSVLSGESDIADCRHRLTEFID